MGSGSEMNRQWDTLPCHAVGGGLFLTAQRRKEWSRELNHLGQSQNFVFGETGSEQLADSVKVSRERGQAGCQTPAWPCQQFFFFVFLNFLFLKMNSK